MVRVIGGGVHVPILATTGKEETLKDIIVGCIGCVIILILISIPIHIIRKKRNKILTEHRNAIETGYNEYLEKHKTDIEPEQSDDVKTE